MLVHEIKAFRYYSDFAGFDIVVVLENETNIDVRLMIEDLVESWFQYPTEVGDMPLPEFLEVELGRKGLAVSIYIGIDENE